MTSRAYICSLVLSALVSLGQAAPAADEVTNLPGLVSPPTFKHYAGYLDATPGKHLFYWFTEAIDADPVTAPLVFWFNGGPGCSSVNGMLTENGPFRVNRDGMTVDYTQYPWNSLANVVFLESPAGVGFAYADDSALIATDDEQVAVDNYAALASFFAKFPEYLANPLFLTGESYGGIYVPTLSYLIVNGSNTNNYNFQGFAVGNGLHEYKSNFNTEVMFEAFHGLFDLEITDNLLTYCCAGNPYRCDFYDSTDTPCVQSVLAAKVAVNTAGVNPYGVYDYCARGFQSPGYKHYQPMNPKFRPLPKGFTEQQREQVQNLQSDPPCYNSDNIRMWINQASVRAALHVPTNVQQWDSCSDPVSAVYSKTIPTVYPHYQYLLSHVRALVYNGDTDSVCNYLGGEYFVESLNRDIIQDYHPWIYQNQTAGFVKVFNNVTFLTILGAGHMVPTDRPPQAQYMLNNFIFDKPFLVDKTRSR